MKSLRYNITKFFIIVLAILMPILATGIAGTFFNSYNYAEAVQVYDRWVESVDLTNNSFDSSTVTSISRNPSGWSSQVSGSRATAGVINTGSNFDNYKSSTYYLSVNPTTTPDQILMINSKNSRNSNGQTARQGYASSSLTLSANSYYTFQVSFKSDTNYEEENTYNYVNTTNQDVSINQTTFNSAEFGDYVAISYNNSTFYVEKTLSETSNLTDSLTMDGTFYFDGTYVGAFLTNGDDRTPIYLNVDQIASASVGTDVDVLTDPSNTSVTTNLDEEYVSNDFAADFEDYDEDYFRFEIDGTTYYVEKTAISYSFNSGAEYATCSIAFNPDNSTALTGTYNVASGTEYYLQVTNYNSLHQYGQGSIYLKGLTDENSDEVEVAFEKTISTEWTTFYFFVATGDTEQTVTLELWLGGDIYGEESTGVVFYDDVQVIQYSENYFYQIYQDYLQTKHYTQKNENGEVVNEVSCVQFQSLETDNSLNLDGFNFNFENADDSSALNGWRYTSTSSDGHARIIALNSAEGFKKYTGYDFVGSNFNVEANFDEDNSLTISENKYALALWANDSYSEVTTRQTIDVDMHSYYKISVSYKISELTGTVYLKVNENEQVIKDNNLNEDEYTLATGSATATENGSNNFTNNYTTLEVYVKGSDFYNSYVNIALAIGSEEESATGCVVFDDVKVEKVSYEEYSSGTNTVELDPRTSDLTIANGYFNQTQDADGNYPLAPAEWTIENSGNLVYGGVINTKSSEFEKYKALYVENGEETNQDNPYLWARFSNPGNSNGNTAYSNNILMLCNYFSNYQTVTSPSFTVEANSYYELTFNFKNYSIDRNIDATFNLKIYNSDDVLLYEEDGISSDTWSTKTIYFETFVGSEDIHIVIEFGTEDNEVSGLTYFDNFVLNTVEAEDFTAIKENTRNTVIDMTDYYMNLPTTVVGDTIEEFSSEAYETTGIGEFGAGGIVNDVYFSGTNFEIENDTEDAIRAFMLRNDNPAGQYIIQSRYTFDLTSGSYYKLTFKLKTVYSYTSSSTLPEDFDANDYDFGVSVGLTNFDYMTNLASNNQYNEYTLYIHATEDASENLYIAMISANEYTTGTAVLYDINFEELELGDNEDVPAEYTDATTAMEESDYDINDSRVFATETPADEEDTGDEEDTTTDETTDEPDYSWLLWISSIITALAIVIAIAGVLLRKVKIKKIEIKRKENYDRKGTMHRDVIRKEAEEERAKQVQELENSINKFETELNNIEKEHKDKVLALRKEEKNSKETEKEFKLFAEKRTVITEKIDILKHQLENIKSPEYLLSLERKKYMEHEARQKQLQKYSKKEAKEKEKKSETDKKDDNSTDDKTKTTKKSKK